MNIRIFGVLLVAAGLLLAAGTAYGQSSDGVTASNYNRVTVFPYLYNGATFDRQRGSATVPGALLTATTVLDPCASPEVAKSRAAVAITTATTTSLVAVSGTTTVHVCGFVISISQVATTANTLKFVRGTGAACVTGPTDLTGAFGTGGITAAAPIVVASGSGATQFKTNAGDALCATTTIGATASFQGYVTYVQQ